MTKKILLGLGTMSLVSLPMIAMASCSSDNTDATKVDLGIAVQPKSTQEEISAAAVLINQKAVATEAVIIEGLAKVFTNIDATTYKNFKATATATVGSEVITLTANEGFAFGTAATLVSKVVEVTPPVAEVTYLDITNNTEASQLQITAAAKLLAEDLPMANSATIEALKLVFTGLVNNENFTAAVTGEAGKEVITLTANEGFAFGTAATLVSKVVKAA